MVIRCVALDANQSHVHNITSKYDKIDFMGKTPKRGRKNKSSS